MYVFVVVLAISFLVVVHEFSHFAVAKSLGLRVEEFSVGFGPSLFSVKVGDTLYSLRLVLFGGFVKVEGLDFSAASSDVPLWKRFLTVLAGPLGNLLLAFLLLFSSYYFFGETNKLYYVAKVLREEARASGLKEGQAIFGVEGKRLTSIEDLRRKLVVCEQPCPLNVMTEGGRRVIRVSLGQEGGRRVVGVSLYETEVFRPEVAKSLRTELRTFEGDRVVRVNGRFVGDDVEFSYWLFKGFLEEKRVRLMFEDGKVADFEGKIPLIFSEERVKLPLKLSLLRVWDVSRSFFSTLFFFFSHLGEMYKQVSGPVGIVAVSVTVAKAGWDKFLFLLAIISFNLAVFNLLPFPALDGGRLSFLVVRMLGFRFSERKEMVVHVAGFILLIGLLLVITVLDLMRLR
jgi:regulator of sigma E protease